MRIRPRLLVASLAAAVLVIVAIVVFSTSGSSDRPADAQLSDPGASANEPGLTNRDVEGDPFPTDVALLTEDGAEISSGDLLGEPLVVNFWYKNCAPCAKELPEFAAVDAARGDEVRIVGVNPADSVSVMQDFAADRGVSYELLRDQYALTDAIGATAMPVTLFVTPDGTIVQQTGVLDQAELDAGIDRLLQASS